MKEILDPQEREQAKAIFEKLMKVIEEEKTTKRVGTFISFLFIWNAYQGMKSHYPKGVDQFVEEIRDFLKMFQHLYKG